MRKVLIAVGIVALALAAWQVREAILLAFAALVVAVILDAVAGPVARRTGLPRGWALALTVIVLIGVLVAGITMTGAQIRAQFGELQARLPDAVKFLESEFGLRVPFLDGSGGSLQDQASGMALDISRSLIGPLKSLGATLFSAVTDLILVVIGGAFLAADPATYRIGLLKLFPSERHARIAEALDTCGRALKLWLLAQLAAMVIIGICVGLGTWFLGVPAPLALGLFAGLAEFVPVVGPIAGAVPAVLLAVTAGVETALWTVGLFLVIQQVESNLINPVLQLRMVSIPPGIQLFAVLAFGVLFGWLGVLIAAPLAVVCYVLVQKLYVEETLGESVRVPGEDQAAT